MLEWANTITDWLYNQQWFIDLDSVMASPSYDANGIFLVLIMVIVGGILVATLGKEER